MLLKKPLSTPGNNRAYFRSLCIIFECILHFSKSVQMKSLPFSDERNNSIGLLTARRRKKILIFKGIASKSDIF